MKNETYKLNSDHFSPHLRISPPHKILENFDVFRHQLLNLGVIFPKNFPRKGGSAPLNPHRRSNLFEVCGVMRVNLKKQLKKGTKSGEKYDFLEGGGGGLK